MTTENEETSWASVAILAAAAGGMAFMIWRSYHNDAPKVAAYSAPAAPAAPRAAAPLTLDALAESQLAARRFDEAAATYRKMLELDPKNASAYNELGLALHYADKTDESLAALRKATALDPKLQRAWLSYGFVLLSSGKDEQARTALKKTIALDPASPQGVEAANMLKR